MNRLRYVVVARALVALLASARPVAAQHGGSSDHRHTGPTAGAGHIDPQTCEAEFEKVVADGRGFGMAFAADKNGYPGPLHVLELSSRLGLTPDQDTKVRAMLRAMFDESKPKSARLLGAESALSLLFESGQPDERRVRAAVADVERARAELRASHLLAHLRTRDVLTPEQRRIYHEARWGAR